MEYRKRPPDGISQEQKLAAAEKVFHGLLCWFPDFREFIEAELGQTEQRWSHEAPGRACLPPRRALGLVATSCVFWPSPEASRVCYVQKKISKKFRGIWTSFGAVYLKSQKQAENSNWHWALG